MKKLIFIFLVFASVFGYAQTPVQFLNSVKVNNPYSADWKYGPWADAAAAKTNVPLGIRVAGLTVHLLDCDCDYTWLEGDLTDSGLVPVHTITTQTLANDAVISGNNKYIQFGTIGNPLYSISFNANNTTTFVGANGKCWDFI